MPKQTFYNLPEGKRGRLMQAIREEFSRVPVEAVSINRIIREAGISRGSFYQYFDGKQDMLAYLLQDYGQILLASAGKSLEENGGDLFGMFSQLLDFSFEYVTSDSSNAFFRSLLADLRVNSTLFTLPSRDQAFIGFMDNLGPRVDMSRLDLRSSEELESLLGILIAVTGEAFARAFYDIRCYPAVRRQFNSRLALLRRGYEKR